MLFRSGRCCLRHMFDMLGWNVLAINCCAIAVSLKAVFTNELCRITRWINEHNFGSSLGIFVASPLVSPKIHMELQNRELDLLVRRAGDGSRTTQRQHGTTPVTAEALLNSHIRLCHKLTDSSDSTQRAAANSSQITIYRASVSTRVR